MKASYKRHYKDDSQGHIFLNKDGACSINLVGAASMTQEELDFYGEIFANAVSKMTERQAISARAFAFCQRPSE